MRKTSAQLPNGLNGFALPVSNHGGFGVPLGGSPALRASLDSHGSLVPAQPLSPVNAMMDLASGGFANSGDVSVSFKAAISQLMTAHSNELRKLRLQMKKDRKPAFDAPFKEPKADFGRSSRQQEESISYRSGGNYPSSPDEDGKPEPGSPRPPAKRPGRAPALPTLHGFREGEAETEEPQTDMRSSYQSSSSPQGMEKSGDTVENGSKGEIGWELAATFQQEACSETPSGDTEPPARVARGSVVASGGDPRYTWMRHRQQRGKDSTTDSKISREAEDILKAAQQLATPAAKREALRRRRNTQADPDPNIVLQTWSWQDRAKWFAELLLRSPLFDPCCAVVIVLNSVLIGYSVEFTASSVRDNLLDRPEPYIVTFLGYACSVFFLFELGIRIISQGKQFFFKAEGRGWNLFDFVLVLFSVVDFLMLLAVGDENKMDASVGSGVKTIKMLRIVRVFRVFRFFRELSLLALMILDSMKSLMWALLMMCIIIYVFAIVFTESASSYLRDNRDYSLLAEYDSTSVYNVDKYFGSLFATVYILVQCMLNGVSWGLVSDTLQNLHPWVLGAFFFYLAFTILAVLNIITGVFVDNAVETARTQRDYLVQKEMELREKLVAEMRDIFLEMDEDGSGTMTLEELQAGLNDPRVLSYFSALGLELDDTARLFSLIDDDGSGDVSIDEFLDGCLRLKGQAKSIDMHSMIHQMRKLEDRFTDFSMEMSGALYGITGGAFTGTMEVAGDYILQSTEQNTI